MPRLTIDGRTLVAEPGATILEVARAAGVVIPTLCHHEALAPWGGCRLCLVDVTRPEWDGWHKAVVSCMARAEDGLLVDTQSERVIEARKVALELLLARCPDTPSLRELAAEHGVADTSYQQRRDADDCILCGLCTRVCEAYATSAIATWGRGTSKAVGTFAHQPPEDCVGCGGCALVCPTGHIQGQRSARTYAIWERTFPTAVCAVDPARCIGCGACEETCPFAVPRVVLGAQGSTNAVIAPKHCRGCGACVGACPTGAIDQQGHEWRRLAALSPAGAGASASAAPQERRAPVAVMACGRSALSSAAEQHVTVLDVPCSGRATAALVLARLCRGDHGVLVLGRHQGTCRFAGAEDPAEAEIRRARQLLELVGVEPERVEFVSPAPGRAGP
ncbi:MAG: 4Fe-4S dicluster domain-containing protein, partial [Deltaproteobacteria bacterium]|nr:4Fe-4S dicluster domain-containing protein [Deltaproteobacteria bacterium]MBW2533180.1 4Fe-4S dicluster domain-containing protein [Deltaproteobacteria bacterium]